MPLLGGQSDITPAKNQKERDTAARVSMATLPSSDWKPPRVADLPSWKNQPRVGFDTETHDPHLKTLGPGSVRSDSFAVGFSFAFEDGRKWYVPLRHAEDNVDDRAQAMAYLRDNLREYVGELVGANIGYDLGYLLQWKAPWNPAVTIRDVQIAEPLICELGGRSNSLKALGIRYGIPSKDEDLLNRAAFAMGLDPKKNMLRIPARYVGPYAENDALAPLRVLREQEKKLAARKIFELESKVTPILAKMRHRGVRFSHDRLAQFSLWSAQEMARQIEFIRDQTGIELPPMDLMSTNAITPILNYIGANHTDETGKRVFRKDLLEKSGHPVALALVRARKMAKMDSTFVQSVRDHAVGDRIHPTFNQLRMPRENQRDEADESGAAYGRLSCEHPNIQQQPSRDDFADRWRSIYLPDEGGLWCSADYSQQEPRFMAHFGAQASSRWQEDFKTRKAAEAALRIAHEYNTNPKTDNHQLFADLTGLPRKTAKPVYLGVCYGMGGGKLARSIGLPEAHQVTVWDPNGEVKYRIEAYFDVDKKAEAEEYRRELQAKLNPENDFRGAKVKCFAGAGKEAQEILHSFHNGAPHIRQLTRDLAAEIKANGKGYIETIMGRRCHFPELTNEQLQKQGIKFRTGPDGKRYKNSKGGSEPLWEFDWMHKALNRKVQGSSADQMKQAMVDLDGMGFALQLQVHDELGQTVSSVEQGKKIGRVMSGAVKDLRVPFSVDVEIGPSWGEAK
jgi:DNA polymerase I-like protein with 3'-5' exonuclease and polymerase domains